MTADRPLGKAQSNVRWSSHLKWVILLKLPLSFEMAQIDFGGSRNCVAHLGANCHKARAPLSMWQSLPVVC